MPRFLVLDSPDDDEKRRRKKSQRGQLRMSEICKYRIVASTNTCYYSENQIFHFLKSRILTCQNFFLGIKLFCLLSE